MLFGTPRLRSGPSRLPFGCSVLILLPVFCRARRAPDLARDCRLEAIRAFTKLFRPLSSLFKGVAGGLLRVGPLTPVPVPVGLFDFVFALWDSRFPYWPAGQGDGAFEINSFGIL